ncbi:MAG: hypothetical protein VX309_07475 [Pseudomonadota bacterium]|nr:hypothetical protein [Pseudomonadota bacterium]MEE3155347.1 hypothetical protein [Pseudomonadota bacterium]
MTAIVIRLEERDLGPAIERMGEAMWQAESRRAAGRSRNVLWTEIGGEDQAKWCQLARASLEALARVE